MHREIAGSAEHAARVNLESYPWWLWWNVLSIDAPMVAVVWAVLFARAGNAQLGVSDLIVLSLAVWVVYTSDRLLDGWTRKSAALYERHLFCARHRAQLAWMVVLAGAAMFWLATEQLPYLEVMGGLKLAAIVAVYIAAIHAGGGYLARLVPKEMAVGALFAAGTTLPMRARGAAISWDAWVTVILFAMLCSVNCFSIECWEGHRSDGTWRTRPHPFVQWADSRIRSIAMSVALAAIVLLMVCRGKWSSRPQVLAVCMASLLIVFIDQKKNRFSRGALRVFADAALVIAGLLALAIGR